MTDRRSFVSEGTPGSPRWIILRTAPPRTLALATALQQAGMDAWTPVERLKRRVPRGKAVEYVNAPITPTYVFVREHHLSALRLVERLAGVPMPSFSIFRYYGDTVFVRHQALHALRARQQESYVGALPFKRRSTWEHGEPYDPGATVKLTTGPLVGLECMVESSDGRFTTLALTLFGRHSGVKLPTSQLRKDGVSDPLSAASSSPRRA